MLGNIAKNIMLYIWLDIHSLNIYYDKGKKSNVTWLQDNTFARVDK